MHTHRHLTPIGAPLENEVMSLPGPGWGHKVTVLVSLSVAPSSSMGWLMRITLKTGMRKVLEMGREVRS